MREKEGRREGRRKTKEVRKGGKTERKKKEREINK